MDITIKMQLYIFLTSIYGGLVAGFFYDLYRISRYYFKPKHLITQIEDLLFWIGISLLFFYILNRSNWGEIRGYVFLGFFLGGTLYSKLLSNVFYPLLKGLFNGIRQFFKKTTQWILFPFKHVSKKLSLKLNRLKKLKNIPKETLNQIKKQKNIISNKK
ncbi:spore cortex biosynthesis protein YabQ [Keratinibaculum paraultunense]|uniref:Spore cortex biosynthesis protein YabQ n=1 Tax=Keratinibaculum paraultunense TaxID=1278232 RepID=A0A4R3KUN2_9FIRM|nr:spore cortex biosynthesis protein YabQ [Keratinibaculum paraultunense]QQY79488.1 spore cortex biosynthesis protein YabQ [Keratinibaculum paraultunense]TCS88017.1 spore cortex biosynthesis protein YabQ [Keratinibaculum paraultunense]